MAELGEIDCQAYVGHPADQLLEGDASFEQSSDALRQ